RAWAQTDGTDTRPRRADPGAPLPVARGTWVPRVIATSRPANPVPEVNPSTLPPPPPSNSGPIATATPARESGAGPSAMTIQQAGLGAPRGLPDLASDFGTRAATPASGLTVEKLAPATIPFGQPITYDIIVRNPGTSPVRNVRVEEQLPAGARHLKSEP